MNVLKFFILLFTITIFVSCAKEINIDEELEEPITFEEPSYIQIVDILFTGSSTVAFLPDLEKSFTSYQLINTGISGSCLDDLINEKENRIFKYNPSYFVFYYGDNDMYKYDANTYIKKFKRLMKELKIRRPNTIVLLISIKPSPLRKEKFNQYTLINRYMDKFHEINPSCYYIDIWTTMSNNTTYFKDDELHLSNKGYTFINQLIYNKIKALESLKSTN